MNLSAPMLMISVIIPCALIIVMKMVSMRSNMDREKSSPFECGFDPKSTARIPFSMRFFLLAIIFIVFDIEIVLLMPIPTMMMKNYFYHVMVTYSLFIIILMIGLIHEWNEGSLDWSA